MPRRFIALAVATAALAVGLALAPPAAAGVTSISVAQSSVLEAPDFASESFADAWDFSNIEDHSLTPSVKMQDLDSIAISGGLFHAHAVESPSADGRLWMTDSWEVGGLPWGRDGALHPIDASRFTRISVRMNAPRSADTATIVYSTCGVVIVQCLGQRPFPLQAGWHTYDIVIGNDVPSYGGAWAGLVNGIAITPTVIGGNFQIDWIRVYEPSTGGVNVTVSDTTPGSAPTVYWDADTNQANNTASNPDWGPVGSASGGVVSFPSDRYPPGTYRFYAVDDGAASGYSSALTIEARPQVRVIQPDRAGGADYATIVRGDPWDFSQQSDVASFWNSTGTVINGELHGQNTGPNPGDAGIMLPSGPIDATRFHRLVARVTYDGPFSLLNAPGGGMNARLAWHFPGSATNDVSDDIVVYPGVNEIAIDLNTFPSGAINDSGNGIGWFGRVVDRVRFDTTEDPGVRTYRVDEIRLAEDDRGVGSYDITFLDNAWQQGSTAVIYADDDSAGFNGAQIGSMTIGPGVNTFHWVPTRDHLGTKWIHVRVTDPTGAVGQAYSTGPVQMLGDVVPSIPSRFVPVSPTRILDTRSGLGQFLPGPVAANSSIDVAVTGRAGVPADATAVVMNVTATESAAAGFITAFPAAYVRPLASNLNIETPGQTIPNLVTVPIGAGGRVSLYSQSGGHLLADVAGYYVPANSAAAGRYQPLTPARILDTRDGTGGVNGIVPDNGTISVAVAGQGGVPATGASAVVLNVTVTGSTRAGYVTVWPSGSPLPTASNLNVVRAGQTIPNQVIVPIGADGRINLFTQGSAHLLADVAGYYTAASAPTSSQGLFVPISPTRLLDTRDGTGAPAAWIPPAGTVGLQITGRAGVPAGARGAVLNVTATETLFPGFVTVWPAGAGMPVASNLNVERFLQTIPNHTTATMSTGGAVSIFTQGGANLIADVSGYFTP